MWETAFTTDRHKEAAMNPLILSFYWMNLPMILSRGVWTLAPLCFHRSSIQAPMAWSMCFCVYFLLHGSVSSVQFMLRIFFVWVFSSVRKITH